MIKNEAKRLGFTDCGISAADFLSDDAAYFNKWIDNKHNAEMHYMERNKEKRLDPRLLVDGAKSIISVLLSYYSEEKQAENSPKISKYAYGNDYHFVIKNKLKKLFQFINDNIEHAEARIFVDSAPVLDRAWAKKSGLGWIGKNSNLITKKHGSFVFIGEIIINIDLEYDQQIKDYCGKCTRCIDACPTNAIVEPYVVDANKCISFLTIENKEEIPIEFKGEFNNQLFGCDICQDVCPWNQNIVENLIKEFLPDKKLLNMTKDDWYSISEEEFKKRFKNSPILRTKYSGLKRNLEFIDNDE
ncbi:MAG: tRNA epoxyqueuosine(34) reductase QueG [Bacteroidetes bacterium]|nr:MAG: tRNA epoxyqueuosine(34) reductase QueG [Bacteroidota bacterium]